MDGVVGQSWTTRRVQPIQSPFDLAPVRRNALLLPAPSGNPSGLIDWIDLFGDTWQASEMVPSATGWP